MRTFQIKDHLIIPFGCPKWLIEDIRVVGVSTTATHFESAAPIAYIDRTAKKPLRIHDIEEVLPAGRDWPRGRDAYFEAVRDTLKAMDNIGSNAERRFIDLYFEMVLAHVDSWGQGEGERKKAPAPGDNANWVFGALLPLPQAHLYLEDPLSDSFSWQPENMVRVDFAFWDGSSFLAVEIDGGSHIGDKGHITRDRMLQRSGVQVVHILNEELEEHGVEAVYKLMPAGFWNFWTLDPAYKPHRPWRAEEVPF